MKASSFLFVCMVNAAYIIFIKWNSISGVDTWYHFQLNIRCDVAVIVRSHQQKFQVIFKERGEGQKKKFWRGGPIFEFVFIFQVIFVFDVVFISQVVFTFLVPSIFEVIFDSEVIFICKVVFIFKFIFIFQVIFIFKVVFIFRLFSDLLRPYQLTLWGSIGVQ